MRKIVFGFIFLVLSASPAIAGSFGVAPTTLVLSPGTKTSVFYVTNHGTVPMVAQIEGFDWKQKDGDDHLEPSSTLMISPPMVKLAPKQQQTVRIAIKPGTDDTTEHTYRLMVSELPDHSSGTKESMIQMLLQFSMPVFVEGSQDATPKIVWNIAQDEKGMALVARNTGAKTAKLSDIKLSSADKETEVAPKSFTYLHPNATHRWPLDAINIASNETVRIKAHEDRDNTTIDATASAGK